MFGPSWRHFTRFGLSALLLLSFLLIVGSSLWERSYMSAMRESAASMYADRLMPATALFQLSDHVYSKRLLLEEHLAPGAAEHSADVGYHLGQLDGAISNLITQIEQTHLVADESAALGRLRRKLDAYDALEQRALRRHVDGQAVSYGAPLRGAFAELQAEMLRLIKIQQTVGKELNDESTIAAASVTSLTNFQLGMAFVLGLVSSSLAFGFQALSRRRLEATADAPPARSRPRAAEPSPEPPRPGLH